MKKTLPTELIFNIFSLLIAFILVQSIYVTVVRPQATTFREQETAKVIADPEYTPQRSYFVVIKEFEQETCFVLTLWAFAILG